MSAWNSDSSESPLGLREGSPMSEAINLAAVLAILIAAGFAFRGYRISRTKRTDDEGDAS